MSVTLTWPPAGAELSAADGRVRDGALTIVARGQGPIDTPVFVNETVVQTDGAGRFEAAVTLTADDDTLTAGLLVGCACVTQRVGVTVRL